MTTQRPPLDPHWDWFQVRRDRLIAERLEGPRLDVCNTQTCRIYRERSARVFIQKVIKMAVDILGNRQAAADWLAMHRSVVSVALNHGELGAHPLAMLLANLSIQKRLLEQHGEIRDEMGRSAFIEASKVAATLLDLSDGATDLDIVNYELLCRIIEHRRDQDAGSPVSTFSLSGLVEPVIADFQSAHQRRSRLEYSHSLLTQLKDLNFAAAHIALLQRNWLDIFVYVADVTEDLATLPDSDAD